MNLKLPIDVYSPDQLSQLVLELQTHIGNLRDANVRAKSHSTKFELPEISPAIGALLKPLNIGPDDATSLEDLNRQLQTTLKKAPVVHLILAASPARTLKRQLAVWFRTEVHPGVLLTFAVRSDIGGGIIVRAGSNIYDLSFKRSILDNKNRLTEIAGV